MINEVDEALRQLLLIELPLRKGEVEIVFDQPRREWSARLNRPTLNVFLYDIRENIDLRASEQVLRREIDEKSVELRHTPVRVDLFYLVTAWAREARDEHNLLGNVLMVLLRHPTFPLEVQTERLKNLPLPPRIEAIQSETIKDIIDLWGSLDNEMHTALRLRVTLAVEPAPPEIAGVVATTEFRFGQAPNREGLEAVEGRADEAPSKAYLMVRGRIASEKYSASLLKVRLRETGQEIELRGDGQFKITRLQEGDYHLEISANDRLLKRQKIQVPSSSYDIQV